MNWLDNNIYLSTLIVGLSCSTACSQISMFFLGTWISGSDKDARKGLKDILYFLTGKSSVYILLAILSSIIGSKLGQVYKKMLGNNGEIVFSLFLILFGAYCIFMYYQNTKNKSCECKGTKSFFDVTPKKALVAGFAYGITPCFPMTVLMVNASMTSLLQALILGLIFSFTSFINPLILVGIISGKVSQAMRKDISQFVKYFQLAFSISFVIIGVVYLIQS